MTFPNRVSQLAEAVADGQVPDWESAAAQSNDPVERAVIAKLRAVHSIHGLMTNHGDRRGDEGGRTVLQPGNSWGGLEVRGHVGRGRFGDVYRAWDPALHREVALKLVRHTDREYTAETRVVDEGRLMARVRHPNVLTIHGAQRIGGVSGLWMEFVEGRTLASELESHGPFGADGITRVGIELARALAAVHRAGLVHRDVKAQNVLRDETGRIVLGDFGTGCEKAEAEEARGGLAGTPVYLAPEIFDGRAATAQSDVYSLGVLLFHVATGQYPVRGRSLRELRDAHSRGARASLAALRPDLPRALVAAVDRALDADPVRRFADASAMADALEASAPRTRVTLQSRREAVVAAAMIAGLAVPAGYAVLARTSGPGSPPVAVTTSAATMPEKAHTPSRRALELYAQARQLAGSEGGMGMQRPLAVEHVLREALREDPDFVMAHVLLAYALYAQPDKREHSVSQMQRAVDSAERRTTIDRHVAAAEIHGIRALFVFGGERQQLQEQAVSEFEAVVGLDPDHEWALGCLTNVYPQVGRGADAVRTAERLVSIRPNSLTALWRASQAAWGAKQVDTARRYAERASALDVTIDERNAFQAGWVRRFAAHDAWLRGDPSGALAVVDSTSSMLGDLPESARSAFVQPLVWMYLTLGRLREAERLARIVAGPVRGFVATRVATATLGHEMSEQERAALRAALARHYPDMRSATDIISTFIDARLIDSAQQLMALLAPAPRTPPLSRSVVHAELALAGGRIRDVIAHLDTDEFADARQRGTRLWARAVMALSQAYVASGQQNRAVSLLVDASRSRIEFGIDGAHAWLPLRDRLAQLYREMGRAADAEPIEDELAALLAVADADHPIKRRLTGAPVRRESAR